MIDYLKCFNSLIFYLILFFGFLLYLINKKSRDEFNKKQLKDSIESIERRSEECPQQYPNGWLPVFDSHELKKGDVKHIFALGRDLVIYRGKSGRVYVFDAYCPHLGANLGVGSTVVGDDIKCHFHGWQFDNQGDCKSIPGLDDKAIPKTSIKKWRCDDVNDYIYVWHHLEENEPHWFMPKFDQIEQFQYQGKTVMEVNCHVQDILENEADVHHFPIVHSTESIFSYFLQNIFEIKIIFNFWKSFEAPNTHCSQTEFKLYLKIGFLAIKPIKFIITQIGPCLFTSEFNFEDIINKNFLLTINIITTGLLRQMMMVKLYYKPTIFGFFLGKFILPFIGIFFEPDRKIMNRRRFQRSPSFTELDDMIIKFRRWYKQFY